VKYRYFLSDTGYPYNADNFSDHSFILSLGTYLKIKNQLGLKIDANYSRINNARTNEFNQFKINIGIVGLFYKAG